MLNDKIKKKVRKKKTSKPRKSLKYETISQICNIWNPKYELNQESQSSSNLM
jgi:hypothetical protein